MALELRQLRHLLALAEHGGFGRAAAALHMTQPALSRSIKLLEEQLGTLLFQRSAAGVTPTDDGRLFVLRARQLTTAADELEREMLRQTVPASGQLVVGCGPFPAEMILPAALAVFTAEQPLVRVRLVIRGDWEELARRLRARELDFVVAETSTLEGQHDLHIEPLAPHRIHMVARAAHPLARRAGVKLQHTFAYPFVAISRSPPRLLDPLLKLRPPPAPGQRERPVPSIEISSVAAIKRLLAASDAVAPLTLPLVADELERGTLALLCSEPWMTTRYGLVTLKARPAGVVADRLWSLLQEVESAVVTEEAALTSRFAGPTPAMRNRSR